MNTNLVSALHESPIGEIRAVTNDGALVALGFVDRFHRERPRLDRRFGAEDVEAAISLETSPKGGGRKSAERDPGKMNEVLARLTAYFDGDLAALDAIEVDPAGTPFQKKVWLALRTIPVGETLSYVGLAKRVGRPKASRAIGAANGANPISLVLPCHRVIRADGDLCGYGGGVERKRWLLAHESGESAGLFPGSFGRRFSAGPKEAAERR